MQLTHKQTRKVALCKPFQGSIALEGVLPKSGETVVSVYYDHIATAPALPDGWQAFSAGGASVYHWHPCKNGRVARELLATYWNCGIEDIEVPLIPTTLDLYFQIPFRDMFFGDYVVVTNDPLKGYVYQVPWYEPVQGYSNARNMVAWLHSSLGYAQRAAQRCVEEGLATYANLDGKEGFEVWELTAPMITALAMPVQMRVDREATLTSWAPDLQEVQIVDPAVWHRCKDIYQIEMSGDAKQQ